MGKSTREEIEKLPYRKQLELKWYPFVKWFYFKGYSLYGFYWGYKLYNQNYELPYWEQWALWLFALLSLYFSGEKSDLIIFLINKICTLKHFLKTSGIQKSKIKYLL